MNDKLPPFPSISELFQNGPVAAISVFVGLMFVGAGIFAGSQCSNKRLLWGLSALCFGMAWYYGSQVPPTVSYVEDPPTRLPRWHWAALFFCVIFAVAALLFGSYASTGNIPW